MANKLIKLVETPLRTTDGSLCQLQSPEIPFEIKRVYFIYGVSEGAVRGAHTHKETVQIIFCIQGEIDIVLDDGKNKEKIVSKLNDIKEVKQIIINHPSNGARLISNHLF